MIEIDGSCGEAGGQILRSALGLSSLLKKPFKIHNLRKGRSKPGLRAQHLTAVNASTLISGARTRGASEGSTELEFEPSAVKCGDYFFDIGTAGSTTLVAQTLLPMLVLSEGPSTIALRGGTHNPMSPPFDFIKEVFLVFLGRLGLNVSAQISSYGFYPKGGGKITLGIRPSKETKPLILTERGSLISVKCISGVGGLPMGIAERQADSAIKKLKGLPAEARSLEVHTPGEGSFVFIRAEYENSMAGFTSLGRRGKRAETVGEEAASEFLAHHSSGMALDPRMADQIAIYLSVSGGDSAFTTSRVTNHLTTNLWLISKFVDIRYSVEGTAGGPGTVRIRPWKR